MAVIVYVVAGKVPIGVPEITQVTESILAQAGSAGVAVQLVIEAPLSTSVVGEILMATPTFPMTPVAPL